MSSSGRRLWVDEPEDRVPVRWQVDPEGAVPDAALLVEPETWARPMQARDYIQ